MKRTVLACFGIALASLLVPAPASAHCHFAKPDGCRAALEGFLAAWNNHAPEAISAFWATDGELVGFSGTTAKGRPAIERLLQAEHTTYFSGAKAEIDFDHMVEQPPQGEIQQLSWTMRITGMRGATGRALESADVLVDFTLVKTGRRYQVASMCPVGPAATRLVADLGR